MRAPYSEGPSPLTTSPPTTTYLTASEAAAILRVSRHTVLLLLRDGGIKATKPGKRWLIAQDDLDAYLAEGSNTPDVVA